MLIKRVVLDQIVAGDIDLIFRRWKRPTVKTGGQLRTAVGMLDVLAVDEVSLAKISAGDAKRAGFASKAHLVDELSSRDSGQYYRIHVRHGGEDPRIALRSDPHVSEEDLADLVKRLDRLDQRSAIGPWTRQTMRLLADNPRVRAQDLAESMGREKPPFKADVAKLKRLGLTISFSPGYELSPRGQTVLDHLEASA